MAVPPSIQHPVSGSLPRWRRCCRRVLASGDALHGVVTRCGAPQPPPLPICSALPTARLHAVTTPGDEAEQPGYARRWPSGCDTARSGRGPGGSIVRTAGPRGERSRVSSRHSTGRYEADRPRRRGRVADSCPHDRRHRAVAGPRLEVALRTHEMEAQRSFAPRSSTPSRSGCNVTDRGYRSRWNRQARDRDQGVSARTPWGANIFDVLDRQPRDLLKREFVRVSIPASCSRWKWSRSASGEARYYRITKSIAAGWARHFARHHHRRRITEWRQAQQRLTATREARRVGQLAAASCTRSTTRSPRSWPAARPRTPHRGPAPGDRTATTST